jgi:hypothetical protein
MGSCNGFGGPSSLVGAEGLSERWLLCVPRAGGFRLVNLLSERSPAIDWSGFCRRHASAGRWGCTRRDTLAGLDVVGDLSHG